MLGKLNGNEAKGSKKGILHDTGTLLSLGNGIQYPCGCCFMIFTFLRVFLPASLYRPGTCIVGHAVGLEQSCVCVAPRCETPKDQGFFQWNPSLKQVKSTVVRGSGEVQRCCSSNLFVLALKLFFPSLMKIILLVTAQCLGYR